MFSSCKLASRAQPSSSEGRINLAYSCVPLASMFNTYSAPTIASANDFGLRLMVEKKTCPSGLTNFAQALIIEAGLGTCSSISMHVTTSYLPACSSAIFSTVIFWYLTLSTPESSACNSATDSGAAPMSMPNTFAPRSAMLSAKIPPPHPTSITFLPLMPAECSSI